MQIVYLRQEGKKVQCFLLCCDVCCIRVCTTSIGYAPDAEGLYQILSNMAVGFFFFQTHATQHDCYTATHVLNKKQLINIKKYIKYKNTLPFFSFCYDNSIEGTTLVLLN